MSIKDNPLWYKDALIYQLHVRSFADSNDDGVGDFQGLTEKLDYLQDLGVTAIWLLPFYPSPLRDDGYDIANYCDIHPMYGSLDDFRAFLEAAHQRDLRVITELVINHTSDQHAWFQRARRASPGSPERDFYVWSDTAERYTGTRIIFKDFEFSNWTWDPIARAYFWHRFYAHQPDLNFDNPAVQQEVLRAADFWLDMGVDGLRLDAIPYLYEREGTNCENLPETHDFLKLFRQHVDEHFADRMLLAEANQWPDHAVAYFGDGDECHMAFHFPLMPRMFISIRMEDRFPITDTLHQTPSIPNNCQWALFLRNHDELTLEMVTAEERSFMYRTYARNPRARINLGIRRRLASLLQNDRNQIELLNGLLFSLPGTPVIYYGDEIGMGDNIYLGDRDGVRTPMQWEADRNAGFSRANPQRIFLPVVIDPEYHYEAVNVETQQTNPHSLLRWMKRLITTRKRYRAFSRGTLVFLYPENRKILAFIRQYEDERILVVANLSHSIQCAELDLKAFRGRSPVELFDRTVFPPIGDLPYFMTLGPHSFYWFVLEPQHTRHAVTIRPREAPVPTLAVADAWTSAFTRARVRMALAELLPRYLKQQSWFVGKVRAIRSIDMPESAPMPYDSPVGYVAFVQVEYTEGAAETYALPLAFASGEQAAHIRKIAPHAVAANLHIENSGERGILYDALQSRDFAVLLLDSIVQHRSFQGTTGEVMAFATRSMPLWPDIRARLTAAGSAQAADEPDSPGSQAAPLDPALLRVVEESNTTIIYDNQFALKVFRYIENGPNPDLEIGRFLTEKVSLARAPLTTGALEYRQKGNQSMTLAVLQTYVPNQGNAWQHTLDELQRYMERVLSRPHSQRVLPLPHSHVLDLAREEVSGLARELIAGYLHTARLLGQRTADLHVALSQETDAPGFVPEPFNDFIQRPFYHAVMGLIERDLDLMRRQLEQLPEAIREDGHAVLAREQEIRRYFLPFRDRKINAMRIRCHGNYQLRNVLYSEGDFVIIDFEGETGRSMEERRTRASPLHDVASILRSLYQAVYAALFEQQGLRSHHLIGQAEERAAQVSWARFWYSWVSAAFLRTYIDTINQAPLLSHTPDEMKVLLDAYLMEKLFHELEHNLNQRPDWVTVPLQGILQVLEDQPPAS